jgi:hypothetical protein
MAGFLKGALLYSLASFAIAQPVYAATSCWDQKAVSAAKVRDLQSRLMVATLRCRAMGVDVLESYNDFVRANKITIQSANNVLKEKFASDYGQDGQAHYDRFTTALANTYGGDATNYMICYDTVAMAKAAASASGSFEQLVAIQNRMGETPDLPGNMCPVSFASRH